MNVLQKLQLARVKLQGTKLEKTGENTHIDYEYFELKDFLPQAQNIFCDVGLCGVVSYSIADGCSLTIYNTEDPNEKLVFLSPWADAALKGCSPVQNIGAAQTYQRRYLWVTALEIVEHDALDATTGSEDGKRAYVPREDMVMTNRLVPKAYWDATDQIVKDKLLGGAGNSVRKVDKQWFIMEPKKKVETDEDNPLRLATEHRPLPTATGPTGKFYRPGQPDLPAAPPTTEGYERWEGQKVIKVIHKSAASGAAYWEILTNDKTCFCKNEKLVEELKMMDSEEVALLVQESVRRKGAYELMDFEGQI